MRPLAWWLDFAGAETKHKLIGLFLFCFLYLLLWLAEKKLKK